MTKKELINVFSMEELGSGQFLQNNMQPDPGAVLHLQFRAEPRLPLHTMHCMCIDAHSGVLFIVKTLFFPLR